MPLQNRVRPDGKITDSKWRGTFMGNRGGRIHNPQTKTLLNRKWASRRWIICVTEFNNRQRSVMGKGYTELFFLDEVSALASGHRPCFECRRAKANEFANFWEQSVGQFIGSRADHMDRVLHQERVSPLGTIINTTKRHLPDGTFLQSGDRLLASKGRELWEWTGEGYHRCTSNPGKAVLLTPPSIIKVLAAGYRPAWHPSIG